MTRLELELHLDPMKKDIGEIKDLLKEAVVQWAGVEGGLDKRVQELEKKFAVVDALTKYRRWIVGTVAVGFGTLFATVLTALVTAVYLLFN